MAPWRVARSVNVLFGQLDTVAPKRNRASDGTIGDTAHQAEGSASDHNPWVMDGSTGVVTAGDYTQDPLHGVDFGPITDALAASRDERIKYMIFDGWILDSRPGNNPWKWVRYYGADQHKQHFHLSVMPVRSLYDDTRPWSLGLVKGDAVTPEDIKKIADAVRVELQGDDSWRNGFSDRQGNPTIAGNTFTFAVGDRLEKLMADVAAIKAQMGEAK